MMYAGEGDNDRPAVYHRMEWHGDHYRARRGALVYVLDEDKNCLTTGHHEVEGSLATGFDAKLGATYERVLEPPTVDEAHNKYLSGEVDESGLEELLEAALAAEESV